MGQMHLNSAMNISNGLVKQDEAFNEFNQSAMNFGVQRAVFIYLTIVCLGTALLR